MHNTGDECITDTFQYKHHAIPDPIVTATDRILKATHQLTAAIEGVQEAAPDKLQAFKSLYHILLGKRIPQQPCPPPPTPLNDSYVDEEQIHMWDPTFMLSPSCPPMQPNRCLKQDVPSLTMMTHHLTLFLQYIRAAPPSLTTMMMHHQWSDACILELNCALKWNPISSIWQSKTIIFPISPSLSNPTNFITTTRRLLRYLQSGHSSSAQTQAVSLKPSSTKIQGTHSSIANSPRSPKYQDIWTHSFANELGWLFQGIHKHKGTNTCFFIKKSDI
jgi:hypothetical protein